MAKPTTHKICTNCGDKITKTFCPSCGQKNTVGRLTWATLGDGFLSSFIGDGAIGETTRTARYGFLTSLYAILTRPGVSIAEYLEGRRRKYFNPITILLLMSGFYALIGTTFGVVDDHASPSKVALIGYANTLYAYSRSHPATIFLVMLPFTALAYKWIFRHRCTLRYIEFAYMGIFAAIFSITLSFLQLPFKTAALNSFSSYASWFAFAAQGWYVVTMFHHLFRVSIRRGIWNWIQTTVIAYSTAILAIFLLSALVLGSYYALDPQTFSERIKNHFSSADEVPTTEMLNPPKAN